MKSVAVIGASADRSKFGNKAVRAYLTRGFTVYPVNPKETTIEGLPAFASIDAVPVAHYSDVDAADWYRATLRFMEIV